jgi:cyanophycin synthetase
MLIDFAAPAFFNVMRATKGHTTSAYLITLAALARGLDVTFFCSKREAGFKNPMFADAVSEPIFYRVSNGRRSHFFNGTQSERTSTTAALTTIDKLKTKALLYSKNLNTPVGGVMSAQDHSLLGRMHQAGVKRFVIKPVAGSLAEGVFLHQTAAQVFQYLQANPKESYMVEQHISGFEHRVYVINGVAVSAYQRVPNHVVGNGTDNVRALFAARQDQRKRNPLLVDKPADMAEVEMALVGRGGAWSDVPAQGQIVWLAANALPSRQGDYIPSLDTLPQSAKRLAVDAAKAVAAYNGGLDIIVEPSGDAYVLEINIRAWIGTHSFPHPAGAYNLTVPNALIQSLFGQPKSAQRAVLGYDFHGLGAEVFREGRTSSGVKAADFAQFG